jgi:glucokinase
LTLPAARSLDQTVAQIADACDGVAAVGVVVPGIYTASNGRAWCPNLWGPEDVPLLDAVTGAIARRGAPPVIIDSDRSGYVAGEAWLGAARGLSDVVFVAIGTGIGVGILSGGAIVRGAHGIAGAAGWFALDPDWKEDYARTGCWEAESAGPGVARRGRVADAESVVAAARSGDRAALDIVHRAADFTAMGVANLVSALNPEAVVLGGGFMLGASDLMLTRVRAGVLRWAQPLAAARCRIALSQLGDSAGLLGAARLALNHVTAPAQQG